MLSPTALGTSIGGLLYFSDKIPLLGWVSIVILAIATYPRGMRNKSILKTVGEQHFSALTISVATTAMIIALGSGLGQSATPDQALQFLLTLFTLSIVFSGYGLIAASSHEWYRDAVHAGDIRPDPLILSVLIISLMLVSLPFLLFAD